MPQPAWLGRWLLSLVVGLAATAFAGSALDVRQLRCEYASNPLGLEVAQPRLSWVLESRQRG